MTSSLMFERILSRFPQNNLRLVFAYGSGVFQQWGHKDMSKNMLDFIFVVDDHVQWHQNNMQTNPKDYSFLKYLGPKYVSRIQEQYGAHVYFNTLVPCDDRLIKYGVISAKALENDLYDWETLYVSGRLHKPVLMLRGANDVELTKALHTNHQSAVHAALMLLSDTFTEEELFCTITGISYSGDFRMTVGEDRDKVKKIVKPNIESFRQLYEPVLEKEEHLYWNKSHAVFEQSLTFTSRHHHLNLLPKMVLLGLVGHRNRDGRYRDTEEVIRSFAQDSECSQVIEKCVRGIVKQSSFTQSVKGIFTAGIVKSIRYSSSKLKKMMKSFSSK